MFTTHPDPCSHVYCCGIPVRHDPLRPMFTRLLLWNSSLTRPTQTHVQTFTAVEFQSDTTHSDPCSNVYCCGIPVRHDPLRPMFKRLLLWNSSPTRPTQTHAHTFTAVEFQSDRTHSDPCSHVYCCGIPVRHDPLRPMFTRLLLWNSSPTRPTQTHVHTFTAVEFQSDTTHSDPCSHVHCCGIPVWHDPLRPMFTCFLRVATFESVQNSLTFPWQFPDILLFFPDNLFYFSKLKTRIIHKNNLKDLHLC